MIKFLTIAALLVLPTASLAVDVAAAGVKQKCVESIDSTIKVSGPDSAYIGNQDKICTCVVEKLPKDKITYINSQLDGYLHHAKDIDPVVYTQFKQAIGLCEQQVLGQDTFNKENTKIGNKMHKMSQNLNDTFNKVGESLQKQNSGNGN